MEAIKSLYHIAMQQTLANWRKAYNFPMPILTNSVLEYCPFIHQYLKLPKVIASDMKSYVIIKEGIVCYRYNLRDIFVQF